MDATNSQRTTPLKIFRALCAIAIALVVNALLPCTSLTQPASADSLDIRTADSTTPYKHDWGFFFRSVQYYVAGYMKGGANGISIDIDFLHLSSDSLLTFGLGLHAGGEMVGSGLWSWHLSTHKHERIYSMLGRSTFELRPVRVDMLIGLSRSEFLSKVGMRVGCEVRVRLSDNIVEALARVAYHAYDDRKSFQTIGGIGLVLGWNP
jgi:hypothetical protein